MVDGGVVAHWCQLPHSRAVCLMSLGTSCRVRCRWNR